MIGKTNRLLRVPKMPNWLQVDSKGRVDVEKTNLHLREEFENIGTGMVDQGTQVSRIQTVLAGSGFPGTGGTVKPDPVAVSDELVKVVAGDQAGYLFDKLKTDESITLTVFPSVGGSVIVLSLNNPIRQYSLPFEGQECTIFHPIAHDLYSVQFDKPMKDGGNAPLPYETYRKQPNRLWVRFADHQYGYATITGPLTI